MEKTQVEELILVNENDEVVGHLDKESCHDGDGILHRAFSIFIFDPDGRLLLQKRSEQKRLWPLHWSNSCCSHPRRGEEMAAAANRRLGEELGLQADLTYLFRFRYQATFSDQGSEHELCSVYVGQLPSAPEGLRIDPREIAEFRWITPAEVDALIATSPDSCTPWFKQEWARIRDDFPRVLRQGQAGE